MGFLEPKTRAWQAPSRAEQAHKRDMVALEDHEQRKRRELKHELETLHHVEEIQHDTAQEARHLLAENARDSSRRRAISGLNDRQALSLAAHEHDRARLLSSSYRSPGMSMLGSPALSSMNTVPLIQTSYSPGLLSTGYSPNVIATPRMRAVSTHHAQGMPIYGGTPYLGGAGLGSSPYLSAGHPGGLGGLGIPSGRPRALSSAGLGGAPMSSERLTLEARKLALLEKEARLVHQKEQRIAAKKSMIDLNAQELALRRQAQELDARANLSARERALDYEDAHLNQRQAEQLQEAQLADRLRRLSVNHLPSPAMNNLQASPRLGGHTRHLSTPMAMGLDGSGLSPQYGGLGASPRMNGGMLDGGLLGPSSYGGGHVRHTSMGHSPMLGSHALDPSMAAEAAALGILPSALGGGGHSGLGGYGGGYGDHDRAAAYARAGVSPRFGPMDGGFDSGYGHGGGGGMHDLGLDDLGLGGSGGGMSRSRRGSLSGAGHGDFDQFNGQDGYSGGGFDDDLLGRQRRNSQPFGY